MTLLTGQARTERCYVPTFFSVCVQAHFEQQEIVLFHCSGVCNFCGGKISDFVRGPLRAYLFYRYSFWFFFSYPFGCKGGIMIVLYLFT